MPHDKSSIFALLLYRYIKICWLSPYPTPPIRYLIVTNHHAFMPRYVYFFLISGEYKAIKSLYLHDAISLWIKMEFGTLYTILQPQCTIATTNFYDSQWAIVMSVIIINSDIHPFILKANMDLISEAEKLYTPFSFVPVCFDTVCLESHTT